MKRKAVKGEPVDVVRAMNELLTVCQIQQRLIATNTKLTDRLLERLSAHGVKDGYGKRAEAAVAQELDRRGLALSRRRRFGDA